MAIKLFLFFFITVFLFSCGLQESTISVENEPAEYTYLALGDSYTIGESVTEEERWPNILTAALSTQKLKISTQIIAKTGWRTDQLSKAITAELQEQKFDLVSLLIGVNNEFQGENSSDFEQKFSACLAQAIKHSKRGKSGVFVVSIPDYGYTPFGQLNQVKISERLVAYNAICQSVCSKENITFFNITPISQQGIEQPKLVARDDLHPSGAQYKLWVDLMVNSGTIHLPKETDN